MATAVPSIRARSSQDTLVFLESFRPGARDEVLARLAPASREAITGALPSSWVPMTDDAAMGREILAHLGPDDTRSFFIGHITHHLDSPLLAATVRTAITLFGLTPASLVKWMPKAIGTVYRDVCQIHIEQLEAQRAVYRYEVSSDAFLHEPVSAIIVEATAHALMNIARSEGDVQVRRDLAKRRFTIAMRWTPKS